MLAPWTLLSGLLASLGGIMIMSWPGNAFPITGCLWGESTGHWWIPLTNDQQSGALMFSLLSTQTSCWTINQVASDCFMYTCLKKVYEYKITYFFFHFLSKLFCLNQVLAIYKSHRDSHDFFFKLIEFACHIHVSIIHWGWVTHICVSKLGHHWFR